MVSVSNRRLFFLFFSLGGSNVARTEGWSDISCDLPKFLDLTSVIWMNSSWCDKEEVEKIEISCFPEVVQVLDSSG